MYLNSTFLERGFGWTIHLKISHLQSIQSLGHPEMTTQMMLGTSDEPRMNQGPIAAASDLTQSCLKCCQGEVALITANLPSFVQMPVRLQAASTDLTCGRFFFTTSLSFLLEVTYIFSWLFFLVLFLVFVPTLRNDVSQTAVISVVETPSQRNPNPALLKSEWHSKNNSTQVLPKGICLLGNGPYFSLLDANICGISWFSDRLLQLLESTKCGHLVHGCTILEKLQQLCAAQTTSSPYPRRWLW